MTHKADPIPLDSMRLDFLISDDGDFHVVQQRRFSTELDADTALDYRDLLDGICAMLATDPQGFIAYAREIRAAAAILNAEEFDMTGEGQEDDQQEDDQDAGNKVVTLSDAKRKKMN